jgi:transcriptional regulator with XRE-family HTH domain
LPGKGSPKRDKGKVCPFGRKVIESKLKYGFGCPKSASRKECEDILCNTRLKPLIIQRFPNMSRSHLSAIEAPNMIRSFSLETLFNLADALMITPSDLLNTSLFSEQINELTDSEK